MHTLNSELPLLNTVPKITSNHIQSTQVFYQHFQYSIHAQLSSIIT